MGNNTRMHSDTKLHPPDTSLDMLKRVLAVAELVATSKQFSEDKQQSTPEVGKKHKS